MVTKNYMLNDNNFVQLEEIRNKINDVTYLRNKNRNVKKYEILNALIQIGLRHKFEVFQELGLKDEDVKGVVL
jgi:hypothetical protein